MDESIITKRKERLHTHGVCAALKDETQKTKHKSFANKYMLYYLGLGNGNWNVLVCLRLTIRLDWKQLWVEHENNKYSMHR